jgi:hypothetical protein
MGVSSGFLPEHRHAACRIDAEVLPRTPPVAAMPVMRRAAVSGHLRSVVTVRYREGYQHEAQLNLQLDLFLKANPEFAARSIAYIGLHSKNIEQGEVFWDPDGYTLLKGTTFSA